MAQALRQTGVGTLINGLRARLESRSLGLFPRLSMPRLQAVPLASHGEYEQFLRAQRGALAERRAFLEDQITPGDALATEGYCICCGRYRRFFTPLPESGSPNWREGLLCPDCHLNSRTRATVHLMRAILAPGPRANIYLTEQITPLFRWMHKHYPRSVGSEFLRDGTARGCTNAAHIRHEDLTALSFADGSFDGVVSLEVMEHIPDFPAALAECCRVLKPGGWLLLGAPFHRGPAHLERARVLADGSIEHILPPEYHGDPLDPQGCLCFHHFGWDLLEYLKAAGFQSALGYSIWSQEFCYMAGEGDLHLFIARK